MSESQRLTWRDWGLDEPATEKLLTLDDLLARANALGLNVSKGAFRHWVRDRVIPLAVRKRRGNAVIAVYPLQMVDVIALLRQLQALGWSLEKVALALRAYCANPDHEIIKLCPCCGRVLMPETQA